MLCVQTDLKYKDRGDKVKLEKICKDKAWKSWSGYFISDNTVLWVNNEGDFTMTEGPTGDIKFVYPIKVFKI